MEHTFINDKGESFTVWMNYPNAQVLLIALNKTETPSSPQYWRFKQ